MSNVITVLLSDGNPNGIKIVELSRALSQNTNNLNIGIFSFGLIAILPLTVFSLILEKNRKNLIPTDPR